MDYEWAPLSAANFAAAVRSSRERVGVSLRSVARTAGISSAYLSDIELGRRMPSRAVVRRIADALGVTPEEILRYDPREGLDEIVGVATTSPQTRDTLLRICRKLNRGEVSLADLDRAIP